MTDRSSLSSSVASVLLVLLAACAHQEAPAPAQPVSPAKSAPVPPPAPTLELAAPPPNVALPKKPEPEAAKPSSAPGVSERIAKNLAAARLGRVKTDIVSIESALENYAINNSGRYPDTLQPLVTPDVNGETYLRAKVLPKDPWDRAYVYEPPGPGSPLPKIYTLGRDDRAGGTGEDADVDNLAIRNEE